MSMSCVEYFKPAIGLVRHGLAEWDMSKMSTRLRMTPAGVKFLLENP